MSGNIAGSAAGFSGTLTGDVTGSQSATSVDRIKGTPVVTTGLAAGKVLKFDGTNWAPADDDTGAANAITGLTGDVSSSGNPTATVTINNNAISTSKLQNGAVDSSKIADDSILDADISAGAAIADSKLATITTAGKVSGSAITSGTIGGTTTMNTSGLIQTSSGLRVYSGSNFVELKAPTLSQNTSYELPAADGGNGQVLTTDGTGKLNWTTIVSSGGTVTGVTANAPLTSSGGTAPVISLNDSGVTAGTYSKVTVSSKGLITTGGSLTATDLPNLAGDVTSTAGLSNSKVEKIQGVSVASTTPVLGQVLMHDASKWNVQYFGFGELRSTVTGNVQMPASCATANKTLNWSAITDTFTCTDISIANTQVSGLGTASTKNFGTSAGQLVELDAGGKIPSSVLPPTGDNLGNHIATTNLNMATYNITGAGKVFLADGAANAPSLTFSNSSSTGLFATAGALGLTVAGTERLRIDSNGNLGLGTTAPSAFLHVEKNQDAETTVQVRNIHDTGTTAGARFIASNEKSGIWFGISGTSNTNTGLGSPGDAYIYNAAGAATGKNLNIINNQTGNIHFFAGSTAVGSARMAITNTGQIGVGTTTPIQRLHVENRNMLITGNGPAYQLKENDTTDQNWQMGINGGNLRFSTQNDAMNSSSEKVVITQAGNVGIGTSSPTNLLTVQSGGTGAPYVSADRLAVIGSSNTVLQITSGNIAATALYFSDPDSRDPGGISYDHATDRMAFRTAQAFHMFIDSTGRTGIGTSTPTSKLEVAGTIHSTSGGIKFPDGSVQTTASTGGGVTWTSMGLTSLGAVSMTTTAEQSFNIPVAAQTASQILVYLRCHSGNASTTGADDIRIYTKEGAATYDHYLLMFPYAGQGAVGYNSDSFWLPKTSDNKIYLAHSMAPGATNSGCNFYITGYK